MEKINGLFEKLESHITNLKDKDEKYKKRLISHFKNKTIWQELGELSINDYFMNYYHLSGNEFTNKLKEDGYSLESNEPSTQRDYYSNVHKYIRDILIKREINTEYTHEQKEEIDELISKNHEPFVQWKGTPKEKNIINEDSSKEATIIRDKMAVVNALKKANYKCEFSENHKLFLRKNLDVNYTEAHHLIPIAIDKTETFKKSVDVAENIVSLCSHCHNLLHYGRYEDKEIILRKLYNERYHALSKCGIDITFEILLSYYK